MLEAELFGHVKGAFTGAVANKPGRFQLADGGTLFLDEIGDLSPKGQGDLLRVLEDSAFRMVGGSELIRVNVRVIAATNKKLQQAVAGGKVPRGPFLPACRSCRWSCRRCGIGRRTSRCWSSGSSSTSAPSISGGASGCPPEALQVCQRFPWPGNVRQLRNIVERLVITCRELVVDVVHLPDFLRDYDQKTTTFTVRPGTPLAEVEKMLIRQTLLHVTSNREEAATALGHQPPGAAVQAQAIWTARRRRRRDQSGGSGMNAMSEHE